MIVVFSFINSPSTSASNITIQQLIDSFDYSYSNNTLNVLTQTDYAIDKNSNGISDTLIVNLTTDAATSGTYTFAVAISDLGKTITNQTIKSITSADKYAPP